jgi:hypothetical protein
MKKLLIILLYLFLMSCSSADDVQALADDYNNISPQRIDNRTVLTGVTYHNNIFGFNYKVDYISNSTTDDVILYPIKAKDLKLAVESEEFDPLRKKGTHLGFIFKDNNDHAFLVIFFSVDKNHKYYINKELGETIKREMNNRK